LEMVARDGPIREANQDSAAARRARIGPRRSESIEPSTRGLIIGGPQKRTPALGRGLSLNRLVGSGAPIAAYRRLLLLDRLDVINDVHDPDPGGEMRALHPADAVEGA